MIGSGEVGVNPEAQTPAGVDTRAIGLYSGCSMNETGSATDREFGRFGFYWFWFEPGLSAPR